MAVLAVMLLASPARSQSASIELPLYDQRIDHPDPDPEASSLGRGPTFGWSMAIGNVDNPLTDVLDDIIIASLFKDVLGLEDVGTSYAFAGPFLTPHAMPALEPAVAGNDLQHMGELNLIIADLVGLAADPDDVVNRVFIPSWKLQADMTGCPNQGPGALVGAVDVFDLDTQQIVASLTPPPVPGASPALPCGALGFGHWLDAADIDGDGYNDLIVGAPISDGGEGRVYIFFGHPGFLDPGGYTQRWLILRPPADPGPPAVPETFPDGGSFGFSLSAADLDGDGMAELAVGRPERGSGTGRVHVFLGYWLASQLYYLETFDDVTPDAPAGIDEGVSGIYETLTDPSRGSFRPPATDAAFGWIVDMKGGDLGQPYDCDTQPQGYEPDFDGKPDLLVYCELAKGYGRDQGSIVQGGALFCYMNDTDVIGGDTVLDERCPAKLMTPRIKTAGGAPKYYPQEGGRFGRAFVVADWETTTGGPTRILVVGEPSRALSGPTGPLVKAGVVWAIGTPIDPSFDPNDLALEEHLHVWGEDPLFEPAESLPQNVEADLTLPGATEPQDGARFGAWIVAGRYDPGTFPGDQIVICARERDVMVGQDLYPELGRVYTITLPSGGP